MNKIILSIGGIIILLILGATQLFSSRTTVSPSSTTATSTSLEQVSASTTPITTTAVVNIVKKPIANSLPISAGDTIVSWSFIGAYANNSELIAKANAEISRLLALVGKGTYPDMSLYVAVANQYELLGEGTKEYDYLIRAVKAGGDTSGLPWHNLGVLMERLGALQTARVAYERATIVQPQLKQWHFAYLEFITTKLKGDVANIEKAFAAANVYFSKNADIIQLRADWEKS